MRTSGSLSGCLSGSLRAVKVSEIGSNDRTLILSYHTRTSHKSTTIREDVDRLHWLWRWSLLSVGGYRRVWYNDLAIDTCPKANYGAEERLELLLQCRKSIWEKAKFRHKAVHILATTSPPALDNKDHHDTI